MFVFVDGVFAQGFACICPSNGFQIQEFGGVFGHFRQYGGEVGGQVQTFAGFLSVYEESKYEKVAEQASFDDFMKIDMRVAKVLNCECRLSLESDPIVSAH